jgi:iron complex outermembrane receptor protein
VKRTLCVALVVLLALSTRLQTVNADEAELAELFGEEAFVSIATGYEQPLRSAPAVATVITADDIEATGKTTLGEILQLVPGFHALYRFQGDQFIIRGIRTEGNLSPDVLIMIDGVPQNDIHLGNQRRFISEIPLVSIERVEVIRGPYSTLYGADAFSGVVNIITKGYNDAKTSQSSVRSGSFDTVEGRWLQRIPLADGTLVSAQLRRTDGHRPEFAEDRQSQLDALFGTDASLAPANANTDLKDYSLMLDQWWDNWHLRLRARGREAGLGIGLTGAFDPDGQVEDTQYNAELHYRNRTLGDWDAALALNFFHHAIQSRDTTAFPPGAFGGRFPDGVKDELEWKERHWRLESSAFYRGWRQHTPHIGAGVEYAKVFDVGENRNFVPDPLTGVPAVALPGLVEVDEAALFSKDDSRTLWYAYVQDEWAFAADWTLTAGTRIDHYSDVGSTVNPQVALVWATSHALTTKLLAGRGFRAPTLFELNAQNNPASLGNPDVDPVTIWSVELAFAYAPHPRLATDLTFFYHEIDDIIDLVPTEPVGLQVDNASGQKGHGLELSARWEAARTLTLSGYYAYQHNERDETDDDMGLGPRNTILLRADWRPLPKWRFNALGLWVADRQRPDEDVRESPDDYVLVDVNLLYEPIAAWTLGLTVNNLLDKHAIAPDEPENQDIPLAERSFFASVKYAY